jgi:hypothetical protein
MTAPPCGAKKHQGEGLCSKPAGWGTDHAGEGNCKLHGGCTPSGRRGAGLRLLERDARELFGKLMPEVAPVDNPLAAYAELAGRVLAWMQLMDDLLNDLRTATREDFFGGEQVQPVIELYERSMDRANVVLGSYARLRIDERLAEITEKQKLIVIRAIEAALDEVGIVDDEARQGARRRVARQLRLINGGAA